MVDVLERAHPLADKVFANAGTRIEPAPEAFRCNLRVAESSIAAVSKALKVTLPRKPKTSATKNGRSALWLGPDEWLIIDEVNNPSADLSKSKALHSAVDISHRTSALIVSGKNAADTLNGGCPQDLSLDAFPVGACSRTICGKMEIVLFRTDEETFRVEFWRSFSEYAFAFLTTAAKDLL